MKTWLCFCLLFCCAVCVHAGARGQLRKGGQLYNDQKYGSALNSYAEVLRQNPDDQRALFNAGNAYYRLNEYTQAQESYKKAAKQPGPYAQSALYNLGNAYYRAGDKEKAIQAYQAAILKNPQDKEAVHNLQLVLQQQQNKQNDQNNGGNSDNSSANQNSRDQSNKGQSPQNPEQSQNRSGLSKSDAERVMAMAKENEYKRGAPSRREPEQTVEKDW